MLSNEAEGNWGQEYETIQLITDFRFVVVCHSPVLSVDDEYGQWGGIFNWWISQVFSILGPVLSHEWVRKAVNIRKSLLSAVEYFHTCVYFVVQQKEHANKKSSTNTFRVPQKYCMLNKEETCSTGSDNAIYPKRSVGAAHSRALALSFVTISNLEHP